MTHLLALFFFLLPAYLIRFHIGPLPTTFLEMLFWIIVIVFIIKNKKTLLSPFSFLLSEHKSLVIAISLFLTAATISIFTSLDIRAALGEWKAFYVEPVIMFFILITTIKTKRDVNLILSSLILSSLITSILAIYQHFTGWLVPHAFWANRDTYRVTAWYGFPNAVGLFLAPLVPIALYKWRGWGFAIPFFLLAILFAKSTGGLIGSAAGMGVLLLINKPDPASRAQGIRAGFLSEESAPPTYFSTSASSPRQVAGYYALDNKKTRVPTTILAALLLITLFSLPNDNTIHKELLMQDRSGQIRVAMWGEATEMLSERPLFGAGLASYAERVKPYHTTVSGEGIEIFHHPHNIFLTMWANLGLLGLVGFVWVLVWFYRVGLMAVKSQVSGVILVPFLLASMTALVVTGFVDSPYIKNDLAMFFWLLPALLIVATKKETATAV